MSKRNLILGSALLGFSFILSPNYAYATNLNVLDHVENAGHTIHNGDTVYRSDFSGVDNYWRLYFSWPYNVANQYGWVVIARGTPGHLDGLPQPGVNYVANNQDWTLGSNSLVKSMGFPLGGSTMPSGTYTVILNPADSPADVINHFSSGSFPNDYSVLTFNYVAQDKTEELPDALASVQYGNRVIRAGDTVHRSETLPTEENPATYWRFSFNWPNAVDNPRAAFIVFRGTFGHLDGGAPIAEVNYGPTFQAFSSGPNVISKSLDLRGLDQSDNTNGVYTAVIAELQAGSEGDFYSFADWFGSGGSIGRPPIRYSTLTFNYKKYSSCCSSVAFLPGIEGSILTDGSDVLWPPTYGHVQSDLDKLAFDTNNVPTDPNISVVGLMNTFDIDASLFGVSHTFHTPIYQGFSNFMNNVVASSSTEVKEWEPLPYDWRYDPEHIVAQTGMVTAIENLAARSNTGKVTLVAHSYGGLVGKALIKALVDKNEGGIIDNYVMVASPQLGTPQAVGGLLHGEKSDISHYGFTFVGKSQARSLGLTIPSAYELLPSEQYFQQVIEPPVTFDSLTSLTALWRGQWGFALNTFQQLVDFMTGNGPARTQPVSSDTQDPVIVDQTLLQSADTFHTAYDKFVFPSGMRVVQVAGWGLNTIKGITYTNDGGNLDYQPLLTSEGDDTVVYPSATSVTGVETYFLNLPVYNSNPSLPNVDHINILSAAPIESSIESILTQSPISTSNVFLAQKPNLTDLTKKLLVGVHSPMTIGVYNSHGNFTGIAPGQDPSADVRLISTDIPGSQYLPYGDGKYILLPEGDIYTFAFQGTASGSASVSVDEVSGNDQTRISDYSSIPVTTSTIANLVLPSNDVPSAHLSIDQNGDGTPDIYVVPGGGSLSLTELITNLTTAVNTASTTVKIKTQLLNKIQTLQNKINKQVQKQGTLLVNLKAQIAKQSGKKIDATTAGSISTLLDSLVATDASVPLDPTLLTELTNEINTLAASSLKTSLLNKVTKLQNLSALNHLLSAMTTIVTRKQGSGKLPDADAQSILDVLGQIQNAL